MAFMRREKIYIGHVGDSGIVLGYQNPNERRWRAKQLTTDHKPESIAEKTRIQRAGGQVAIKSGVPRVVWNRPRDPMHRGPIRRRTQVDAIPFLAVARSLGDLWSYNSRCKEFVVSPDPDVKVVKIDPSTFRYVSFPELALSLSLQFESLLNACLFPLQMPDFRHRRAMECGNTAGGGRFCEREAPDW